MGVLHHSVWLQVVLALSVHHFIFWNHFVWLRITDEGSIPKMRIRSILLIRSDLKWCMYLSRCVFIMIKLITWVRFIYASMVAAFVRISAFLRYNADFTRCASLGCSQNATNQPKSTVELGFMCHWVLLSVHRSFCSIIIRCIYVLSVTSPLLVRWGPLPVR